MTSAALAEDIQTRKISFENRGATLAVPGEKSGLWLDGISQFDLSRGTHRTDGRRKLGDRHASGLVEP
ncbi:hypothetical protein LZK73_02975 [Neorhizobium galegae]|nr:hypothetical protein LZK73_02975 [Neorhizobium galegae]